jgi:hypothetical protein
VNHFFMILSSSPQRMLAEQQQQQKKLRVNIENIIYSTHPRPPRILPLLISCNVERRLENRDGFALSLHGLLNNFHH